MRLMRGVFTSLSQDCTISDRCGDGGASPNRGVDLFAAGAPVKDTN
jgi:hypothetical protein